MSRAGLAGAGLGALGLIWLVGTGDAVEARAILCLAAAGLLVWPSAALGRNRTPWIVALALVSVLIAVRGQLPDFATSWKVRVWNVYHYYLGAKYFRELGYTDLYRATLRADQEGNNYWRVVSRVRDLDTYEILDRDWRQRTWEPSESFTPERWSAFRRDVEALSEQRSPRAWRGIFVDRGYNATPLWTVVGATLAAVAPADNPLALKILCSLDLALLAATFRLLWTTFGPGPTALVLLLLTASPVNAGRFVGGFLQYDWFCAVAASVCWYRRGLPALSAAGFAYATLTRIFPVLLVAAGVVPLVRAGLRTGSLPRRPLRFLGAFSGWCLLGLVVSLPNGRGLDGWREFATGIELHKESHVLGERRVGLEHLFTHRLGSLALDKPTAERREVGERQGALYAVSAAVLLAAFALVAWRLRSWQARLLGLVPIFALLVTSRYYWSYLALLPLVGGRRGPAAARSRWLGGGQLLIFAATYVVESLGAAPYAVYVVFGTLLLVYLVFALSALRPTRP